VPRSSDSTVTLVEPNRLAELVAECSGNTGVVGGQAALFTRTDVVAASFGAGGDVPVTDSTKFAIGSTTKLLTAVLVHQLVEAGVLDLDAPLCQYLPDVPLFAGNAMTAGALLSMTSGLDNGPYVDHWPGADRLLRYCQEMAGLPRQFEAGRAFGYSNASTVASGLLIERLFGSSWSEALDRQVLGPAGMADTSTFAPCERPSPGYRIDERGNLTAFHAEQWLAALAPAGSTLLSTATDLALLGQCLLGGRDTLLGSVQLERMCRPVIDLPETLVADAWSLGPFSSSWGGTAVLGHTGTNSTGSSLLVWLPDLGVGVACAVNTPAQGYPFAQQLVREVLQMCAGVQVPDAPVANPRTVVDPEPLIGTYSMTGLTIDVVATAEGLGAVLHSRNAADLPQQSEVIALPALSPTRFLAADDRLDGNRGWALSFEDLSDGRAARLLNGVFALRRVA
jgi:CubicO group peptidase (beta-lactamase class C family)